MGLPTVAMGILGAVISPLTAASLLIIPSFVTNVWQLLRGPDFLSLAKRFWLMMLGIVAGTLVGSWPLTSANTDYANIALGSALLLYAAYSLFAKPLSIPARLERTLSPIIGLTTGLINGATGVFSIPAVPFLQSVGLSKEDLIQAFGLAFTVSTIALGAGLARSGAFQLGNIGLSTLAVVPSLLGLQVGTIVRGRISPARFRRWFLILLGALGLEMILRPFLF